ncbi:EAL domain-containing protein [Enterovibrio calviensis]|uniref:EAL domain-containing protein n=1 Tax=Enterovibrio calviensis TaxID=91359 RepID=UPI000482AD33|nr:EAL domain-containing protein [Enterovibrio calviensis]
MKRNKQDVVYYLVLLCVPLFFSVAVGLYLSKLTIDHHAEDFGNFYMQTLERKAEVLSVQVGVALSEPARCDVILSRMEMWPYINDYAVTKDGKVLCQSNHFFDWIDETLVGITPLAGLHSYRNQSSMEAGENLLVIATEEVAGVQGFAVLTKKAFHEYLDLAPSSRYSKLTIWIDDTPMVGKRHADQVIGHSVDSEEHHISIGASPSDSYVHATMAMFVLSSIPVALLISLMAHFLLRYFAPRLSLADDIKRGLDRKEFYLQYQPIYGNDNKLHGFEALARWQHPHMGYVSPEIFIPEIENQQLSMLFTRYVFERVVEDMGPLKLAKPYHLGVNVPPSFMCSDELDATLKTTLEAFQRVNLSLTLEVTERQLLNEEAIRHIDAVRQLGIRVAIDDFGVGHTSLSMLQRVHFDYLKIDKCFVDTVGVDSINAPVLESIIELAHRLNVDIVAEGVEKIEQSSFLAARGCQFQQGYLHDRPLSIEAVSSRFVFG